MTRHAAALSPFLLYACHNLLPFLCYSACLHGFCGIYFEGKQAILGWCSGCCLNWHQPLHGTQAALMLTLLCLPAV